MLADDKGSGRNLKLLNLILLSIYPVKGYGQVTKLLLGSPNKDGPVPGRVRRSDLSISPCFLLCL